MTLRSRAFGGRQDMDRRLVPLLALLLTVCTPLADSAGGPPSTASASRSSYFVDRPAGCPVTTPVTDEHPKNPNTASFSRGWFMSPDHLLWASASARQAPGWRREGRRRAQDQWTAGLRRVRLSGERRDLPRAGVLGGRGSSAEQHPRLRRVRVPALSGSRAGRGLHPPLLGLQETEGGQQGQIN